MSLRCVPPHTGKVRIHAWQVDNPNVTDPTASLTLDAAAGTLTKRTLGPSAEPEAVCADGGAPVVYDRDGAEGSTDVVVCPPTPALSHTRVS